MRRASITLVSGPISWVEMIMASFEVTALVCKYCGQIAGKGSTCPVYSDPKHVFVEMRVPAVCKYCGQLAGVGSKCPVGSDERHVFVEQG